MVYYLLDTSALIERYLKQYKTILDLMHLQKLKGEAFFYFPNICVAEVFNTFARMHYREKKINQKEYNDFCNTFKGHIRDGRFLYPYNLYRYHNYNADSVYEVEHTTQPLDPHSRMPSLPYGKCWLSSIDILIISMGMELQKIHGKDKVHIVTNDERLAQISNSKPAMFPSAVYLRRAKPQDLPKL